MLLRPRLVTLFAACLVFAGCGAPAPAPPAAPAASPATGPTAAPAASPTSAPVAASPAATAAPNTPPGSTPTSATGGLPLPTPIPRTGSSLPAQALLTGDPYSFEQYLAQVAAQGLSVKRSTREYRVPYFTVVGASFDANDEQALVWLYPDTATRERDSAKLAEGGAVVNGERMPWRAKPNFFAKGNLLVQFVSNSDDIAAKLRAALDGLP